MATSITNNLDKKVCQNASGHNIDSATAYTIENDIDARYPTKNCVSTVPAKLKNKKYDTLIVQGGSIDINNINTKDEPIEEHLNSWKNKVKKSSERMFKLAEDSASQHPGLEVIIVSYLGLTQSLMILPK